MVSQDPDVSALGDRFLDGFIVCVGIEVVIFGFHVLVESDHEVFDLFGTETGRCQIVIIEIEVEQ